MRSEESGCGESLSRLRINRLFTVRARTFVLDRCVVARFCASKSALFNRFSENAVERRRDIRRVFMQSAVKSLKRICSCEIHSPGNERALLLVIRHGMSLKTVLHLQAVFKFSQEDVGVRKLCALALSYQLPLRKAAQTYERVWGAKPGVSSSESKLQSLSYELNLAYPAAAEFYVEASGVVRVLAINLLLCKSHV